jgi:hypothetical protein
MMNRKTSIFLVALTIAGCRIFSNNPTSTPPPGWRIPVSGLFLDISTFPKNWLVDFSDPKDYQDDPTINHVFREWKGQGDGRAWQNIWRGFLISDAEELYTDLRKSQFVPKATLPPDVPFTEFSPPKEINLSIKKAYEYYFACGVWRIPYCEIVARYNNYVTNVHLPLMEGVESDGGLSYEQIETILEGMDQQFIKFFETIK